jgi:hypothetical protein
VEAKFDKFDGNTSVPDTEWLGLLGREGGWAFVPDDHRIYKNPQERSAMLAARVIGFFLEPAWRKRNVTEYERGSTADPVVAEARATVRGRSTTRCLQAAIQAYQPAAADPSTAAVTCCAPADCDEFGCGP